MLPRSQVPTPNSQSPNSNFQPNSVSRIPVNSQSPTPNSQLLRRCLGVGSWTLQLEVGIWELTRGCLGIGNWELEVGSWDRWTLLPHAGLSSPKSDAAVPAMILQPLAENAIR